MSAVLLMVSPVSHLRDVTRSGSFGLASRGAVRSEMTKTLAVWLELISLCKSVFHLHIKDSFSSHHHLRHICIVISLPSSIVSRTNVPLLISANFVHHNRHHVVVFALISAAAVLGLDENSI